MERYSSVRTLGSGSDGSVARAVERATGKAVAIKTINGKFWSFEDLLRLREVRVLQHVRHPHIVLLKEVIRQNDNAYLIFEVMDSNLHEWLRAQSAPLAEDAVRNLMYRLVVALQHIHARGFIHRDIKPENLLVDDAGDDLKVADFAAAADARTKLPRTDYVSTRWYRAPEVLLRAGSYSTPIDMWAVGVILAECLRRSPLFPGTTEIDQLHRITAVLGPPDAWREGASLMERTVGVGAFYSVSDAERMPLRRLIPSASADALHLIESLLKWDPDKRLSASQCLRHPFFASAIPVQRGLRIGDVRTALVRWARQLNGNAPSARRTKKEWECREITA